MRRVAVAVHRLAEQRHLAHAGGGEGGHLGDDLAARPVALRAAGVGHDAERAALVAALHDGDERRPRRTRDLQRGEEARRVGVEDGAHQGRRAEGELVEEARQLGDVVGADDEIDAAGAREQALPLLLRDAAGDDHGQLPAGALLLGEAAHLAEELLLGLLAHAAGVEDDDVGLGGLDLGVAGPAHDLVHPLRVVDVHLAAERGDGVRGHGALLVTKRRPGCHWDRPIVAIDGPRAES